MSSSNSPCAACKFLRLECTQGCMFAPYFPPEQPQKFANVHRVFGVSNVVKLLNEVDPAHREDAVNYYANQAEARLHDPVYGCLAHIKLLRQRLKQIHWDLYMAKKEGETSHIQLLQLRLKQIHCHLYMATKELETHVVRIELLSNVVVQVAAAASGGA